MASNRELMKKLKKSIEDNYEIIRSIQVNDIVNVIFYELNELKQLYTPVQYIDIKEQVLEYTRLLLEHIDKADYKGASKVYKVIFELYDMIPDIEIVLPFLEDANYEKALNRHIRDKTIIVMGDSHSCFFSGNEDLSFIPIKNDMNTCNQNNDLPFTVLHLGPCLAYNADKYGSKNRVREKVEWLNEHFLCQNDTIIFSLGEIDVRNQIFRYADNNTYKEAIDVILEHYLNLLMWLKSKGYNIICYGPIGSMKDSAKPDEYRPRVGSEIQRNMAGRYYNEELEKICQRNQFGFFTLFYDMVNSDNMTDARFLASDELHLNQFGYHLAIEKLLKLGITI